MAKLFGIGVGPGDSELLTIKAIRAMENSEVIFAPSAFEGGESIAYETAKEYISEDKKIEIIHFPMGKDNTQDKARETYEAIYQYLKKGMNVSFLTIGDPFVYSTYTHLLNYINERGFEVVTVPGITSFCASAAVANEYLVLGNEPLMVTPAARLDAVKDEKFLVIMKVYKREEEVVDFLDANGFDYVYIKKAGRVGEEILRDREEIIKNKEYMALILAKKKELAQVI
ncbi:cobalt-factor II C(20)-methyltransferase [Oceanirhabdus seepicola]|uniref:Cobalt-factor II C(20)-methyltransferase n=1 Tax=Oceanirhabdus seepicola TaxID=2828781 RepID=A0A9J6P2B4_9CLOT|nr:cobalt-factor II C(20)-methyltransferase [Oceanirhabdus seepicola]MCM1990540.1 cobalt-factor II C(20)-methyltransferase [Oceanirhabdus seepicola]